MIRHYVFRLHRYYQENGFIKTSVRLIVKIKRILFQNDYLLYYSDLKRLSTLPRQCVSNFDVQCANSENEVTSTDLLKLFEKKGEAIAQSQMNRFSKGASLWLFRQGDDLVGFVWTICKTTIEPYFFPLTDKDVHVFDNEIFVEYRGKGVNSIFINNVLDNLAKKGYDRAYIETKIWNIAEIHSLSKTYFSQYAMVKKVNLCGKLITIWPKKDRIPINKSA